LYSRSITRTVKSQIIFHLHPCKPSSGLTKTTGLDNHTVNKQGY